MKKFEEFKKELKKIDTKTLIKKESEMIYNLYYHDLILCAYEPRDQILELIKKYNYEIRSHKTVTGAIRKSKELNKIIMLVVKEE